MYSKFLRPLLLVIIASATVTTGLYAQSSSPWPFPAQKGSGKSLTVAFWNIQWFPGRNDSPTAAQETSQINSVHADMKKLEADIIGMEEIRDFNKVGLAVQPLPGFKVDVCANFPPGEGRVATQEVAIASHLPAISAWAEEWKAGEKVTPPRGFAFAAYQFAPRQLVLVYAFHLKSNRGQIAENMAMRQESIRQFQSHHEAMEKAYSGMGTLTTIVGGDFNTSMDDPQYASETTLKDLIKGGFAWTWQDVQANARLTLPSAGKYPPASFDHMFYKNATLKKAYVASTSPQSSDHRAIVATFDLPAAK